MINMYYADLKKVDIANGEGVRVSLFVSGCRHHCKGCFNEIAWNFKYGKEFTEETVNEIMKELDHDYVEGLSLLGGEPLEPENQTALADLVEKVKEKYPNKNINLNRIHTSVKRVHMAEYQRISNWHTSHSSIYRTAPFFSPFFLRFKDRIPSPSGKS